jgi:hypothetical protein
MVIEFEGLVRQVLCAFGCQNGFLDAKIIENLQKMYQKATNIEPKGHQSEQ